MQNPFRREDPDLEAAIGRAFEDLEGTTASEGDYTRAIDNLVKLQAMRVKHVDPNTVLVVGGNIVLGLAVLNFERLAIVSTRVKDFMLKI